MPKPFFFGLSYHAMDDLGSSSYRDFAAPLIIIITGVLLVIALLAILT